MRYHHLKLCIGQDIKNAKLTKFNNISFYIGILASVGITMVGCFQETNVAAIHFIGAAFAFGGLWNYYYMKMI